MRLVFIEYFLLPRETLVFRIEPDRHHPHLIKLPIGRKEVRSLVRKLRASVVRRKPACELSHEVFQKLMKEAVSDLVEQEIHLVIIPHDELHHLPFTALWSGTEYLGELFTVSQLPSLHTLYYIRERIRRVRTSC